MAITTVLSGNAHSVGHPLGVVSKRGSLSNTFGNHWVKQNYVDFLFTARLLAALTVLAAAVTRCQQGAG